LNQYASFDIRVEMRTALIFFDEDKGKLETYVGFLQTGSMGYSDQNGIW